MLETLCYNIFDQEVRARAERAQIDEIHYCTAQNRQELWYIISKLFLPSNSILETLCYNIFDKEVRARFTIVQHRTDRNFAYNF